MVIQKAADAILIESVGKTGTGFTTVENKIKDKKNLGEGPKG
jgi:hypothetical protein